MLNYFNQYKFFALIQTDIEKSLTEIFFISQRQSADRDPTEITSLTSSGISTLNNVELSISEPKNSAIIHMDVDQNFLPIPSVVKASIFESFARQNMAESETDVQSALQQLLKSNYGFLTNSSSEFIYGNSPVALFNKLVLCCKQERGTLLFPSGTNGNYVSAANFMKAKTIIIPTQSGTGFKIVPKTLENLLGNVSRPWVYISGPTINPTGLLYSNKELRDILCVCARFGARVVIDTSSSGLEFKTEGWSRWDMQSTLSNMKSLDSSFCVSLLGGLSFEMLTGGLGFGFLVLTDPQLIDLFHIFPSLSRPHSTVKYAVKKLLGFREQRIQHFLEAIAKQKEILKSQSSQLSEVSFSQHFHFPL